jgi:exopolysaccharide production protein ExoQ
MITAVASSPAFTVLPGNRAAALSRARTSARIGLVLLFLLTFINGATFRRGDEENYHFDWHIALRIALCAACGLYGLAHLRNSAASLLKGAGLLVTALGCWVVLIVPFSMEPTNAAGATFCLWCVILFTAAIKDTLEPRQIIQSVAASLVAFLVGSWFAYLFWPSLGREVLTFVDGNVVERFGGLGSSQSVGLMSALAVALLLVLGTQRLARWKVLAFPLALAALTIYVTDSRTSAIAAAAAVVVAAVRSMRFTVGKAIGVLLLPLVAAIGLGVISLGVVHLKEDDVLARFSRSGESVEMYNVSGRSEIWSFFLDRYRESPLVGYGLGCSRFVPREAYLHAHNQVLNVFVETGLFGGALVLLQFFVLGRRFFVARNPYFDLFFVIVLVGGLTERVILAPIPDSFTVLWLLALLSPAHRSLPSVPGRARAEEVA